MNNSALKINQQFNYLTFLSVLYAVLMVTAQTLAYRLIKIGPLIEPGGIFIFPLSFAISDIIAEVYGPSLAKKTIFMALFAQAFYSITPLIVNNLPHPINWQHADAFKIVLGSSWLVFLSNLCAVSLGMTLNTQLIGKTKIAFHGKYFSFRSLFSSAIGEFILTAIIVLIALVPIEGVKTGCKLFIDMFLFKFGFSILFIYPASLLVVLLKKLDNTDIYEENISLNPLSILKPSVLIGSNIIDFSTAIKNKK